MLCLRVNRNKRAWSGTDIAVAAAATAMVCKLIIFPNTPPLELVAAMRTGDRPRRQHAPRAEPGMPETEPARLRGAWSWRRGRCTLVRRHMAMLVRRRVA